MAMPKFNKPEGMLDSIKSKLGFSDGGDYYDRGRKDYDDYDSGDYDDYDDDYEEVHIIQRPDIYRFIDII